MNSSDIDLQQAFPVISDPAQFDHQSGWRLERLIFNNRIIILIACALITALLGFQATKLNVNSSFDKMIPRSHPYIQNYFQNIRDLRGLGNSLRVVVENRSGDIYNEDFLKVFRKVNDRLYLTKGIDRPWLKSILMANTRWQEVTEDGYAGGPIMPPTFSDPVEAFQQLRQNVKRAATVGTLVGADQKSAIILAPLIDVDPATGIPIDYKELSDTLESELRSEETANTKIHIVGFAKLIGDLIDGLEQVASYFAISVAIAAVIVFGYTRCVRSTALLIVAALVGVVWLLGLMHLLGFVLDPYSILVPFLIFAIGLSHGAQKMNGIMQDIGRGTHKYVAARYTFRRLFMAGLTALLTNLVGFAVFALIDIPIIKEMALITSMGVGILIFTKLLMIPIMLSYIGVSPAAAKRSVLAESGALPNRLGKWFSSLAEKLTQRRWASMTIIVSLLLGAVATTISFKYLQTGDLDAGAPELLPNSRYNRDIAYIGQYYGQSSDQFAIIQKTAVNACDRYQNLLESDRLAWHLQGIDGVLSTNSYSSVVRFITTGAYEGSPKWNTVVRNQSSLNYASSRVIQDNRDLINTDCSVFPMIAYLSDHKAATLDRVLKAVESFALEHNSDKIQFLPAAGSAGIEAITNIVVRQSHYKMLLALYSAVIVLCYVTFRNWRAVVVALIPLLITSALCEALMVTLGIGEKVSTLPVIALGVGVGVDYALYLLSVQCAMQRRGYALVDAYKASVAFTGKIVVLVALTLAVCVITWAWSPIKFQADMGILLTFMFIWNMIGALVLIPALSHFLLPDKPDVVRPSAAA